MRAIPTSSIRRSRWTSTTATRSGAGQQPRGRHQEQRGLTAGSARHCVAVPGRSKKGLGAALELCRRAIPTVLGRRAGPLGDSAVIWAWTRRRCGLRDRTGRQDHRQLVAERRLYSGWRSKNEARKPVREAAIPNKTPARHHRGAPASQRSLKLGAQLRWQNQITYADY